MNEETTEMHTERLGDMCAWFNSALDILEEDRSMSWWCTEASLYIDKQAEHIAELERLASAITDSAEAIPYPLREAVDRLREALIQASKEVQDEA
jgi:hypothetical protein